MSGGVWRKCSSPPISTGKTDNQSLIKNKHDSERTVWGCVYFIISVCPELLRGTGVPSRFCFSEIHLHLRVRERALMVATPDISPFSRQSRPSSRQVSRQPSPYSTILPANISMEDIGPRTSCFGIVLVYNEIQKTPVRSPHSGVGSTNKCYL